MTMDRERNQPIQDPCRALGGDIERLPDFVAREGLTLRMVVELAAAVAENLAHLHGQRRAHGSVVEKNILVCDGVGWLAPPEPNADGAAVSEDVQQFRDLFGSLLAHVESRAATAVFGEIDALLERLPAAATPEAMPAVHGAGRQMKRVALGLKVLRGRVANQDLLEPERPLAIVASRSIASDEPASSPPQRTPEAPTGRKIVMMLRAVSESERPEPEQAVRSGRRFTWYAVVSGTAVGAAFLLMMLFRTLR